MTFTKGERTAIIILAAVILLIIAANFFVMNHKPNVNKSLHNLDSIIALHEEAVDDMKARELAEQMEREARNKKIREEREKKKLQKPKKPDFKKKEVKKENSVMKKEIHIVNLNTTDTLELMQLPEIGAFFARNIVDYREKLGGYIDKEQLLEVYGFDSIRLEIIAPFINIDSVTIRKIRINYDDFKTILKHPYIEYEDVKKVVNHRESKGMIKDWETYLKVVEREDIDKRLRWYLEF
ncbi:MAG: helix-hairpin-helix domain-containing protein [Bacteroidales bacterium]|nr:helix-hairpin-helix domain-containing protein [Bacteroidales bacterium]